MNEVQDIRIINKLIKKRRSTFPMEYNGKKIEKEVVEQILKNASWAPNHGKTEPWRFKVFFEESLFELMQFMAEHYKENTEETKFSQVKYDRFFEKAKRTSHIIAICMKHDPKSKIPETEDIAAVSCAVQNIYLTTTAYDLRGYWSTGGGTYSKGMHTFLNLSQDERCLGFFYLGISDKPLREGERKHIDEKTEWL